MCLELLSKDVTFPITTPSVLTGHFNVLNCRRDILQYFLCYVTWQNYISLSTKGFVGLYIQ